MKNELEINIFLDTMNNLKKLKKKGVGDSAKTYNKALKDAEDIFKNQLKQLVVKK